MIFQQILLQIFHKFNKERTISAAYHLLRGKRSGQTIQDVGIFKLYDFFGLLPKLSRQSFDAEVAKLVAEGLIHIQDDGYYVLTEKACEQISHLPNISFDGWHYRGNEHIFFARLTLVVQSLSYHKEGEMSFSPVVKEESTQKWVKSFLRAMHYQSGLLQQQLFEEIKLSLEQAQLTEQACTLIIYRLSGVGVPGWTWQQLAHVQGVEPVDVQLQFIEGLHNWLHTIDETSAYPLLQKMAEDVRVVVMLTGSANQTAQLFRQGYSIEQIAFMRGLKLSTIEDHLVELAMNDPKFPIEQFVSKEDICLVSEKIQQLRTRKLKNLHEAIAHLSYFQLRLIIAKGEN